MIGAEPPGWSTTGRIALGRSCPHLCATPGPPTPPHGRVLSIPRPGVLSREFGWLELNQRPSAYQADALYQTELHPIAVVCVCAVMAASFDQLLRDLAESFLFADSGELSHPLVDAAIMSCHPTFSCGSRRLSDPSDSCGSRRGVSFH